jgi:hypothetical protein
MPTKSRVARVGNVSPTGKTGSRYSESGWAGVNTQRGEISDETRSGSICTGGYHDGVTNRSLVPRKQVLSEQGRRHGYAVRKGAD